MIAVAYSRTKSAAPNLAQKPTATKENARTTVPIEHLLGAAAVVTPESGCSNPAIIFNVVVQR